MPIVVCSACSTKFTAPDSAAGRKLKCPSCQAICLAPAAEKPTPSFEVVEDEPEPERAPPKAVARAVEDDEEERPRSKRKPPADEDDRPRKKRSRDGDDDDEDRPRRKKRKLDEDEPAKSSKLPILIVAGVLALGGVGFAAYWFGFRGKPGAAPSENNPTPVLVAENWETYTSPDNAFKVSFPGKPESNPWKPVSSMKVTSDIRSVRIGDGDANKTGLTLFAGYVRFPDGVRPVEIADAKQWITTLHVAPATFGLNPAGGDAKSSAKPTMNGKVWDETRLNTRSAIGTVRWHLAGTTLYLVGYRNNDAVFPKDIIEKFFASHELPGGEPRDPDPVKLDGWEPYTSPDMFKVEFPGAPKKMIFAPTGNAKSSDFQEFTARDEKSGLSRTYIAGCITFPKKPTPKESKEIKDFAQRETDPWGAGYTPKKVTIGDQTWDERRMIGNALGERGGGIVRCLENGSKIFVVGLKNMDRAPPEKEVEKFFGSFVILAPLEAKELDPPAGWSAYRPPGATFRAFVPNGKGISSRDLKLSNTEQRAIAAARRWTVTDGGNIYNILTFQFVPDAKESDRLAAINSLTAPVVLTPGQAKLTGQNKVVWAGRDALENAYSLPDLCAVRLTHNATVGYAASVHVQGGKLDEEKSRIFFNGLTFDKE